MGIDVNFKRQIKSKNNFLRAKINTDNVFRALEFLKQSGHPEYKFYTDIESYKRKCLIENLQTDFIDDEDVDYIMEIDEYLSDIKNEDQAEEKNNEYDDEEE